MNIQNRLRKKRKQLHEERDVPSSHDDMEFTEVSIGYVYRLGKHFKYV